MKPDTENPLPTQTATEKNWKLSTATMRNLSLSIWAVFLEKTSIKLGAARTHIKNGHFNMQSLDTESLKDDPSDQYIEALCRNPKVKEFMRLGSLLCKPVYIVTGLKVAKGFTMSGVDNDSSSLTVEAGGEMAPEASLGMGGDVSSSTSLFDQFESDNDIIFAYQLMMIKPKGWTKEKKIVTSDFRKHALLSDGRDVLEEKVEAERDILKPVDLKGLKSGVHLVELTGDGNERVIIVYKEAWAPY